jgi:predicted amidohydrolase
MMSSTVRVGAIQTKRRSIRYTTPFKAALDQVRENLDILVGLAEKAKEQSCDIIGYPEDTLGTLEWTSRHVDETIDFLRAAQLEMLDRLGAAAGRLGIPIICCNDWVEDEGDIYNTAILLGPDGNEIGRYQKVQPTISEQSRKRGSGFPVFEVPGIGTLGLCICYDMLFPKTTRALALAGADLMSPSPLDAPPRARGT